jgi:hypothetical protein
MDDGRSFFEQKGTVYLKKSTSAKSDKKQFGGIISFLNNFVRVTCDDAIYSIPYENILFVETNHQTNLERF